MTCGNCGSVVDLVESSGATDAGRFVEAYQCPNCGSTGRVTGESSDPPSEWQRMGAIFG
jgi:DNA-directed RNA polymerase subunit RPC12/RpoP